MMQKLFCYQYNNKVRGWGGFEIMGGGGVKNDAKTFLLPI